MADVREQIASLRQQGSTTMREFFAEIAPALDLHELVRAVVIVGFIALVAAMAKFGMGL
jgi:hypothetical protein